MEWAEYGIRVNSVSPGLVKTAMTYWVEQQPDWQEQLKYYRGIPRLAEVEELGGAYVYLLSDAAAYTTSIDIPVNGVIGSAFEFCRLIVVDFADEKNSLLKRLGYPRDGRIDLQNDVRRYYATIIYFASAAVHSACSSSVRD
jgi:hypothetical protein